MTDDEVRALAMGVPEVVEAPHHERTSFRVRGKIFTTLAADGGSVNVLVNEADARAAADAGEAELLWWGRSVAGVRLELPGADADVLAELLEQAWRRRAPRALVAELDARG